MCVAAWFDIHLNCFDRVWESIFHVLAIFPCSHAYANHTKCSVARFIRCLVNIYTSILTPTKTHWLPIKRAFNWIYPHAPGILFQSFLFAHAVGYYAQLTDNFNSCATSVFFFNFLSFVFVSTENFEICCDSSAYKSAWWNYRFLRRRIFYRLFIWGVELCPSFFAKKLTPSSKCWVSDFNYDALFWW